MKEFKYWIVGVCGVLAVAHILFPSLGIDAVTISLVVVASLPWLVTILKSAELPGGIKIEFKEAQEATNKILEENLNRDITPKKITVTKDLQLLWNIEDEFSTLRSIAEKDPNLAFVGVRIEIEKRIRQLAKLANLDEKQSLTGLVRALNNSEILTNSVQEGLIELIHMGNNAAHGAEVNLPTAEWLLDIGPSIIKKLDSIVESNEK